MTMDMVIEFVSAAMPWIIMGLFVAVYAATVNSKKTTRYAGHTGSCEEFDEEKDTYMSEGMAMGMCFGVAIGTAVGQLPIGLCVGMLIGMVVGRSREKHAEE